MSAGSALSKPQRFEIAFAHESIDRSDWVVLANPVIEPLREQQRLRSALTFDESLHRRPSLDKMADVLKTSQPSYDLRAFDISEAEFEELLGRLCVRLGFCISSEASQRIWNQRLATIDEFLDALYLAEGLENDTRRSLRSAAKSEVQQFIASRRSPSVRGQEA